MQTRFQLVGYLGLMVVAFLAAFTSNSYAQWFEFCDDFTKPPQCHRDPFEERIETERHDFTQSAVTVGRGVVQFEGGYSYFYKDSEGEIESAHTAPEMLLRAGLTEDIEFRLRWNYVWQFIDEAPDRIGSEDLRYSLKLQMTKQRCCGLLPTSALELQGTAPTGSESFTTEQVEFRINYIYQWELTERISLAGSTGFGTDGYGDFGLLPEEPTEDHFVAMSQSAVLGVELTECDVIYTEWFGIFSDGLENEFVVSVFNIGIDHYLTDNFVLDLRAGLGLTDDSDDFFCGAGGAYRF